MSIESGVDNYQGSFDGRYIAYQKNGEVSILDLTSGVVSNIDSLQDMTVSYFKWIYNSDRLIIAEKNTSGSNCYAKLYYYDMKTANLTEIRNNHANSQIKINLTNKTSEITDIDMSSDTGKTYIKTTTQSGVSKVLKIDAFIDTGGPQSLTSTVSKNIGKIQCLKWRDSLLYEDSQDGYVYMYGSHTPLSPTDFKMPLSLLGYDSSDNVYFADVSNGVTNTIYTGNFDGNQWSWKTITLNTSIDVNNTYIQMNGDIYFNDKTASTMIKVLPIDISSGASSSQSSVSASTASSDGIKYKGTIISVFASGFITIYNNEVIHYDLQ
jgi:hypothetical protein